MITRRELLKSATATATVPIAKEKGEAIEQRQHRHLAASQRFYADGLGWRPDFENKEIVFPQAVG